MSYRLAPDRTLPEELRRIVAEELDGAVERLLGSADGDRVTAVHESRKHFKKARSVLRLARGELGGTTYRRENARLREAGNGLSDVRDAHVAVQTLDKLTERFADELPADAFADAHRVLAERRRRASERLDSADGPVDDVVAIVRGVRARLPGWPLDRDRWRVVGPGLRRQYARGAARFAQARRDPTAVNLHEWRKRVKDLWYHLRLLRPVWPGVMDELADRAHDLSDRLGDDHDLSVLRETLDGAPGDFGDPEEVAALLDLVDRRRAELRLAAWRIGRRLYADDPGVFDRRMKAYWKAARAEAADPPTPPVDVPLVVVTPTGRRFHRPGCPFAGAEAESVGREEAERRGLPPCGSCGP
ncbi:MAG: CHAD domain-containing protein [Actinobacteria bacterium]|nr:CHAD domain-containing protein [Actinomycetota bacterium]